MSDTKETKHPGEDPDWLVRAREGLTNPSQSKTASPDPAQEVSPVVPNPAPETEQIERKKSYMIAWQKANIEKCREAGRRYYARSKEKRKVAASEWRKKNREKSRAWYEAFRSTPEGRLLNRARSRITNALKGSGKSARSEELLGCPISHLKTYLEAKFLPGMTWANHGLWEIDHIRPCASFDLSDPAQQKECFHYSNLQPLWKPDNRRKGAMYVRE